MPRPARIIPIALACLAAVAASGPARAAWTRTSGPIPPPVAEFHEHDGRWFLGTNFADSGDLFASDDAGATWSDVGQPNGGVSLLFSFGADLYMGAYLSGLSRSTDGGDTWQEIGAPFQGGSPEAMLAIDAQTLLVGMDNFFGVPMQRSTDAGATWSTVAGGPSLRCFDLALAGSAVLAAGEDVGVHRSTDGGVTWSAASTGLPAMADAHRFVVDGADVYVTAESTSAPLGVYRSTDTGLTWTPVSADLPSAANHNTTAFFLHAGDLYLGTTSTSGNRGLFRSANGGVNWTKITTSLPGAVDVGAAAFLGGDLHVGTFDGAFRTTDGGATWTERWHGASGVFGSHALLHDSGRLFAGIDDVLGSGNSIVSTTDDGTTWQASAGVGSGTAYDLLSHGGNLYAAVYGGIRGVYVSTDGGSTFTLSGTWSPTVVPQCLHDHDGVLLAGASDRYFRSTDDGATWTGNPGLGWVRDFASLDGFLYAGLYPGGVSRSSDAGLTWTPLSSGMPGGPHINALAVFDGAVYAAVNVGPVMRWNGSTWIDVGLDGEFVYKFAATEGALVAGTAFSKVFATTDGSHWIDFSDGFTGGIVEAMGVTPDRVVIGTRGKGIWSRSRAELPGGTAVLPGVATEPALRLAVAPNPFAANAAIRFELPRAGAVTVDVFDLSGRRIRRLLAGSRAAGAHSAIWNGHDDDGRIVGNGVYFLRVETAEGDAQVRKVLRMR
jgi:FlgD Ig-like domain